MRRQRQRKTEKDREKQRKRKIDTKKDSERQRKTETNRERQRKRLTDTEKETEKHVQEIKVDRDIENIQQDQDKNRKTEMQPEIKDWRLCVLYICL